LSPATAPLRSVRPTFPTRRSSDLAAHQFEVRAPLKEVGLTKSEIRQLSAQLGLPTADKPQMACLSSRIPHGEPVTEEKLRMIERDRKSTRLNSSHQIISYAVFCLK